MKRPPTEAASCGHLTAVCHAAPYRCTTSTIAKCAMAQVSRVLHDLGPACPITHLRRSARWHDNHYRDKTCHNQFSHVLPFGPLAQQQKHTRPAANQKGPSQNSK